MGTGGYHGSIFQGPTPMLWPGHPGGGGGQALSVGWDPEVFKGKRAGVGLWSERAVVIGSAGLESSL